MALKDIKAQISLDIANFQNALKKASSDTQAFSKGLSTAMNGAKAAVTAVTTALAGVGVTTTAAAKSFMDTEAAITKVNTLIGLSGQEYTKFSNDIRAGAQEAGMAYDDFAEAVYQAISAGVQYGDAVSFVNESNKLAKGGFTDLSTATDITTTVLNAYKMSAEEQTRVMDLLIQTQNKGKTTVNELGSSLGQVIPIAKANNVAFDQVSAAIAKLTAGGISTGESVTYLKSMVNELGKSGTEVADVLKKETGKSFQQLMEDGKTLSEVLEIVDNNAKKNNKSMSDLFGSSEAATAAMSLLGDSTEEFNTVLDQMNEATGVTNEAFGMIDSTLKEQLSQSVNHLKNGLSDLGAELYDRLGPYILEAIEWFSDLVYQLKELPGWIEENKSQLTYLAIAVGTVTTAIAAYVIAANAAAITTAVVTAAGTAFGAVLAFLASPITITIAAIGLLVAAGYALWENWDWVSEKAGELGEWISKKWDEIKVAVTESVQAMVKSVTEWWENLKADVSKKCSEIKESVLNKWNQIKSDVSNKVQEIKTNVVNKWTEIKTAVVTKVTDIKDGIKNKFTDALTSVKDIFNNIKRAISDKMEDAKEGVRKAIDKIKGFFNFEWSLPKIKLPHFSISGNFSLNPPSVPKFNIDWYSSGGIFTKKSILPGGIGVGDAINGVGDAAEAVLPIDELPRLIGLDKLFSLVESANEDKKVDIPVVMPEGNITMQIMLDSYQLGEAIFPIIDLLQSKQIRLDTFALGGRT